MRLQKIPKGPLILGCVCLGLAAVIGTIMLVRREERAAVVTTADPDSVRVLIDRLDVGSATSIAVEADGENLSLTKTEAGWILFGDPDTPVRQETVNALLSRLETLVALREIGEGNLAEYGLDDPAAILTLDCGDCVYRLCFGDANAAYGGYYFKMEGRDTVYLVENSLYSAAILTPDSLLELPKLPDLSDPLSLELTLPNGQTLSLPEDGGAEEENLLAALESLTISHRVDYGRDSDAAYGLDRPTLLIITARSGENLTLRLGRGESGDFGYLRLGDSPAVYLFYAEPLDALFGSDSESGR